MYIGKIKKVMFVIQCMYGVDLKRVSGMKDYIKVHVLKLKDLVDLEMSLVVSIQPKLNYCLTISRGLCQEDQIRSLGSVDLVQVSHLVD